MGKIRQFEDGYSDPDAIALSYQSGRNQFWEIELAQSEKQYAENIINNSLEARSIATTEAITQNENIIRRDPTQFDPINPLGKNDNIIPEIIVV